MRRGLGKAAVHLLRILCQCRLGRRGIPLRTAGHGTLECAAQVHRLILPQGHIYRIRQSAVCKGVLLAGGHGEEERLTKGPHRFRGLRCTQPPGQLHHVHCGIAVQGGGVVLHRAQMACTGVVLYLTVIHGGKVIVLVLHGMGGDTVRHLRSGVIFQGSFLRHHAAKQHHICRRIFYQRLFIFFIFRASSNNQLCQRLCLCRTYENQGIRSLFIIALNANIFQSLFCHLVCFLLFRVQHKDLLLHQFCCLFGALAHIQLSILRKGCAHGVLPCLRGNSGAEHTAVHSRFGAAGIVPVDAAGRDGLQNVEINIQALIHDQFSFSFSSGAGFGSRYRSCPHRRRTLAGVCTYRGSVHCNSYRSAASCG